MEPQRFTDERGDDWLIVVDIPLVKTIRAELDVDLLRVLDDQTVLSALCDDVVRLVDLLFVCCRDQATKREIDDVEFGRRLHGDAVDRATSAFLAALCDFFPPAKRQTLRKILDKIHQVESKAHARAETLIESGRFDQAIDAELDAAEAELFRRLEATPEPGGKSSTN